MLRKKVKIKQGPRVVDFGDGSRLKSDLALSTNLPADTINEIVGNVRKKLSKREQPVFPHDITTTTHFVMVEMGLKTEGDKFMQFIVHRRKSRLRVGFFGLVPKPVPRRRLDRGLLRYIARHRGEISIPDASRELGVSK